MGGLCARNCKYQNYSFLHDNDVICPFFYCAFNCYSETGFNEELIDKYYESKWEEVVVNLNCNNRN